MISLWVVPLLSRMVCGLKSREKKNGRWYYMVWWIWSTYNIIGNDGFYLSFSNFNQPPFPSNTVMPFWAGHVNFFIFLWTWLVSLTFLP